MSGQVGSDRVGCGRVDSGQAGSVPGDCSHGDAGIGVRCSGVRRLAKGTVHCDNMSWAYTKHNSTSCFGSCCYSVEFVVNSFVIHKNATTATIVVSGFAANYCLKVHPSAVAMVLTKIKLILLSGECYMGT